MCYGENGTVKFFETLADNVEKELFFKMAISNVNNLCHQEAWN
jgi:hypothetical protein